VVWGGGASGEGRVWWVPETIRENPSRLGEGVCCGIDAARAGLECVWPGSGGCGGGDWFWWILGATLRVQSVVQDLGRWSFLGGGERGIKDPCAMWGCLKSKGFCQGVCEIWICTHWL
jgi:hypothetical protein